MKKEKKFLHIIFFKISEQLEENVITPSEGGSLITSRKIFQLDTYKS